MEMFKMSNNSSSSFFLGTQLWLFLLLGICGAVTGGIFSLLAAHVYRLDKHSRRVLVKTSLLRGALVAVVSGMILIVILFLVFTLADFLVGSLEILGYLFIFVIPLIGGVVVPFVYAKELSNRN